MMKKGPGVVRTTARGAVAAPVFLVALLSMTATLLFSADAFAQGKAGNTVGAPAGAVGGGVSGSNRGGAAGVSNPSPGGGPSSQGEPGQSSGSQSTENSRPGYLGGRNSSSANPGSTTFASITELTTARFGKCPTPGSVMLSPQARLSGINVERLEAVSQYLNRGPQKGGKSGSAYLLADLQEELQREKPDLTLAGTYLGIIMKTAVTPQLANDIGESLCSPMSWSDAEFISKVAEAQRRSLARDK